MRRSRTVSLLLAAPLAAALASVTGAGILPGLPATPRHAPAIVKTAQMLPGASYPWVHPLWVTRSGVEVATFRRGTHVTAAQPPASIRLQAAPVVVKTAAILGAGYRWVQPLSIPTA